MRGTTVGIDIGTTAVTTVVAGEKKDGTLHLLGVGSSPSAGVRRGAIVDAEASARALRHSLLEASRQSGVKIRSAVVGISGAHLGSSISHSAIAVSKADGEITEEDVSRVLRAAEGFAARNPNREIIHLIPRQFRVDGQGGIIDPVGMIGMKLEAEVLVVDGARSALQNVVKCCELVGIEIEDWLSSTLAAAEVLLTKKQKELGVMLLDLGAGTSDFSVFEEGRVIDVGSFPIGGGHITSDIAIGFRVQMPVAEEIKIRHAAIGEGERTGRRETIALSGFVEGDESVFQLRDLSEIVVARLTDILELAAKFLKKIGRAGLLPGGVVLTGGVANIPGLQELARRELKLPVEVARAVGVEGVHDVIPPRLAIPVGLILWQRREHPGHGGRGGRGAWSVWRDRLKRMLRSFVP